MMRTSRTLLMVEVARGGAKWAAILGVMPVTIEPSWRPRLNALAAAIREAARGAIEAADRGGSLASVSEAVRQGAGDVTYAVDERSERAVEAWADAIARERPLSLLTEDTGWRHLGPVGGRARELPGFDHGGPRIALDPIDGT